MSVCSPCFDSGISVASCNAGISFGVVPAESNYIVTITHNGTRRIQQFNAASDVDGIITIVGAKLDPLQGYTIALHCDKFTICEQEYDCISFSVVNTDADPEDLVINLLECVECGG